jgi:hypothetical protein
MLFSVILSSWQVSWPGLSGLATAVGARRSASTEVVAAAVQPLAVFVTVTR